MSYTRVINSFNSRFDFFFLKEKSLAVDVDYSGEEIDDNGN